MVRAAVLALCIALGACAQANVAPVDSAPQTVNDAAIDSNGCSTQPCSILPQCGCNGNTACDFDLIDRDGTTCRPINAAGTETSSCMGPVECDRGFVCIGGSTFASCKKYCTGDADCGAPRGKCIYVPDPSVPKVCSSNCDPTDTTAAGCPSTYKCSMLNYTDGDVVDCTPAGTMTQGADCTSATNTPVQSRCAKGYECAKFTSEATFKCRRVCSAPGTTTGCAGQQCVGYTTPFTVGGTSYGVCGP